MFKDTREAPGLGTVRVVLTCLSSSPLTAGQQGHDGRQEGLGWSRKILQPSLLGHLMILTFKQEIRKLNKFKNLRKEFYSYRAESVIPGWQVVMKVDNLVPA